MLTKIQAELKAPKSQFNDFGNYNYRSCEDILEAVKPLLVDHGCTLTITDSIECHGDRVYVCATARFKDAENNETEVKAYAREQANKKGMDESQVTGATSSYARKYALNGLFLIDDNKDADGQDNRGQGQKPQQDGSQNNPPAGVNNKQTVERVLNKNEVDQKWNGKIYAGDTVYIDKVRIKPPVEQLAKLKTHPKYKGE